MKSICFPQIKDLQPRKQRFVIPSPNRHGIYELGPFTDNAYGIGDLLMLTPLARALGKRAVILLPEFLEPKSCLFHNLCQIKFTDNYPVFPFPGMSCHIAEHLLKMFGLFGFDPIPRIDIDLDKAKEARELLDGYPNPVAFCPTCSRTWSHVRQRPPIFWKPVIDELRKRYDVLQFGFDDYPLLPGAIRFPFVPLDLLGPVYHLIGNYVGVHTGDYHLMIACGGRVVVAEPDPMPDVGHNIHWNYHTIPKRVQYAKLSHPSTVIKSIKDLGL